MKIGISKIGIKFKIGILKNCLKMKFLRINKWINKNKNNKNENDN